MRKRMPIIRVQPYIWENEDVITGNYPHMQIRVWTLDNQSKSHLLRIEDYPVCCYVELPTFIKYRIHVWNVNEVNILHQRFCSSLKDHAILPFRPGHFTEKRKLYYYRGDRCFPMLLIGCKAHKTLRALTNLLRNPYDMGNGIRAKFNVWEAEISPIRKILTELTLTHTSWLECEAFEPADIDKISTQQEWLVSWRSMRPLQPSITSGWMTCPGVLAFDIETYSHRHKMFPDMWNPLHKAYMISVIYQRVNSNERYRYAIIVGECDEITNVDNTMLLQVNTEEEMIAMFAAIIDYHNPEIITGYHIFGFDWDYLDARLNINNREWPVFGRLRNRRPKMHRTSWKSDGYGQNDTTMLELPGCIALDTLLVIKRDYKMDFYDLNTVSMFFVQKSKHDVKPQQMFVSYERSMAASQLRITPEMSDVEISTINNEKIAARAEMTKTMLYCIQDSELVLDILDKIHFWLAAVESAAVAGINIESYYRSGQQQRGLSLLYNATALRNRVLDNQPTPDIPFAGGYVKPPMKGIHDNVITLDFLSMYPSIIIGYNICYTTLVPENLYDKVPDDLCHIIEVEEATEAEIDPDDESVDPEMMEETKKAKKKSKKSAKSDKPTTNRIIKYKYLKEPRGILPEIVKTLIDKRNAVKALIKSTKDPLQLVILDKRQLALKVMTNSIFGFTGVRKGGKRPLLEASSSITGKGRWLINDVNTYLIEKYGATIVYGDTDSSMIVLPQITHPSQCNEWGHRIAKEVSERFPEAINMEFEKANRMLLLDKKMYAGFFIEKDGTFKMAKKDRELLVRGILIARRDNCKWARDVYRKILLMVLDREKLHVILRTLLEEVFKLLRGEVKLDDLVIIRTLNSHYARAEYFMNVFANELRRIGKPAQPGDRLKYVVTVRPGARYLGEKLITPEIYMESLESGEKPYVIDYHYYIVKVLENHMDKVIRHGCKKEIQEWQHVSYRPTNRHKPSGLNNVTHTIGMILEHGHDIMDNLGKYVLQMEAQDAKPQLVIVDSKSS